MQNHTDIIQCQDVLEMKAFYTSMRAEISEIKSAQRDEMQRSNIDRNLLTKVVANQENLSANVIAGFTNGRIKMDGLASDIRILQDTVTKAEGSIGATRWIGAAVFAFIGLLISYIGVYKQ